MEVKSFESLHLNSTIIFKRTTWRVLPNTWPAKYKKNLARKVARHVAKYAKVDIEQICETLLATVLQQLDVSCRDD